MPIILMEEFDPLEYKLLVRNPRISYRDLANNLGVSIPVVFNRIQQKIRSGSLRTFTTISTNYLNASLVTVFGVVGRDGPIESMIDDLRKNGQVCYVAFCSPNMVIATGLLRHSDETDGFLESISDNLPDEGSHPSY